MELSLERKIFTENSTVGELSVNGSYFCHTLEDRVRAPGVKIAGQTAIPEGVYQVAIDWSPNHHRNLPHILDVPMFTGIRIHVGNYDRDTEGCILVGVGAGPDMITESQKAFDMLFPILESAVSHNEFIQITVFRSPEALIPEGLIP